MASCYGIHSFVVLCVDVGDLVVVVAAAAAATAPPPPPGVVHVDRSLAQADSLMYGLLSIQCQSMCGVVCVGARFPTDE